mmetsp:Transcript_6939/g.25568  ORF Transcript_6939/g.25568 Transcript_6939/m.25568 type:complete len:281 (+) Transcript_6939:68-910(+)
MLRAAAAVPQLSLHCPPLPSRSLASPPSLLRALSAAVSGSRSRPRARWESRTAVGGTSERPIRQARRTTCMAASGTPAGDVFFLDTFCLRQWDPTYSGTCLAAVDKVEFVKYVHEQFKEGSELKEGYAPFCKHVFVPNAFGCVVDALPITSDNEKLLRSSYQARTDAELPVLQRYFLKEEVGEVPVAKYLDVILYSRDQLVQERAAMESKQEREELPDAPWGIISIKAQDVPHELPMTPITMMRNALGKEEGGSGVPLDREKYMASVTYWQTHGVVIDKL